MRMLKHRVVLLNAARQPHCYLLLDNLLLIANCKLLIVAEGGCYV